MTRRSWIRHLAGAAPVLPPLLAGGWATGQLLGQQPPKPTTPPVEEDIPIIKVDVDLVNIFFNVRTKKSGLVPGLTKDDFTVFEDGKQVDIKSFARETNLPLTIGLLVDTSGSQEMMIPAERAAARKFFASVIGKQDQAFLISFGTDAELMTDLTNSQKLLNAGLNELRLKGGMGGGLINPGPVPVKNPKGTVLYDAVALAADEKLKNEVGRKAMIVLSDGEDMGSSFTIQQAIESAQKADTIIYTIGMFDLGRMGRFGHFSGEMEKMSKETGGRYFEVGKASDLDFAFTTIQEEMRTQYQLSFTPANPNRDGGFRKLEIRPKNKDFKVQARRGYYATK